MKNPVFVALCLFLFATPALAESADHSGPVPAKGGHVLRGGVGGSGNQKSAASGPDGAASGPDDSEQHGAAASSAGAGAGAAGAGAGAGDPSGAAARVADVVGDLFGDFGGPNSNRGNSGVRGAPGPVAGAGLPLLGIACGVYWLIRRRRKAD